MVPLYIRFPNTKIQNPSNSKTIASHLVFSHFASGSIQVIANETAHIIKVLETSTRDLIYQRNLYLANEDTYLVTETPHILNVAIVNTPKITQKSNKPLEKICKKYKSALSK